MPNRLVVEELSGDQVRVGFRRAGLEFERDIRRRAPRSTAIAEKRNTPMQPNRTACLAALACIASPALAGGEAYRVPEYPAPPVVVYAPPPPPAYAIGGILTFPFQFLDGLFGAPQPLVRDGYGGLVPFTNSRVMPDGTLRPYDPTLDGYPPGYGLPTPPPVAIEPSYVPEATYY